MLIDFPKTRNTQKTKAPPTDTVGALLAEAMIMLTDLEDAYLVDLVRRLRRRAAGMEWCACGDHLHCRLDDDFQPGVGTGDEERSRHGGQELAFRRRETSEERE